MGLKDSRCGKSHALKIQCRLLLQHNRCHYVSNIQKNPSVPLFLGRYAYKCKEEYQISSSQIARLHEQTQGSI